MGDDERDLVKVSLYLGADQLHWLKARGALKRSTWAAELRQALDAGIAQAEKVDLLAKKVAS